MCIVLDPIVRRTVVKSNHTSPVPGVPRAIIVWVSSPASIGLMSSYPNTRSWCFRHASTVFVYSLLISLSPLSLTFSLPDSISGERHSGLAAICCLFCVREGGFFFYEVEIRWHLIDRHGLHGYQGDRGAGRKTHVPCPTVLKRN